MKTVIIYGQNHKGSTYQIAHNIGEKIGGDVTEFFLPKDLDEFCLGCTTCFVKGEESCPHFNKLNPITKALDEADVIILASPVYVFHATGGMKNLLDHYGYRWMAHRPDGAMFKKQAICVSTAAGAGMKSTIKDMADSLFYWGVPKIYKLGIAVAATSWDGIKEKKKLKIEKKTNKIVKSINKKCGKVKPGFKLKFMFFIMRLCQIHGWNPKDIEYWKEKGWLGKARPWK